MVSSIVSLGGARRTKTSLVGVRVIFSSGNSFLQASSASPLSGSNLAVSNGE